MNFRSDISDKIKEVVQRIDPESDIIIFGSKARGDSNMHSDWDVLILLQTNEVPFSLEKEIIDSLYEIELETGMIISPLIYSKSDWYSNYKITPLFVNITREGIVEHDKTRQGIY
ncbi:MAG: nucleotidyltransferase domain-containing protein [Bacteroidetes bacterium]|nr:nucleotidyltransferase domain-containing protein [Bacteroidota bacterium]